MMNIEARIEGSSKLTDIFGYWPSFHDAEVTEFNHQNAILGLDIVEGPRSKGPTSVFSVTFRPAFGLSAGFICLGIGVLDAVSCTEHGALIA
jgi:hypothetical protein